MKTKLFKFSTMLFGIVLCSNAQAQTTIYVDSANLSGTHDGLTWATAFNDFQMGITTATTGDSVFVAKGTYQPASGVSFSMKEGVKIYGGFSATDNTFSLRNWQVNTTILKGNANRVIDNSSNNLTLVALLDGFIVTRGGNNNSGGGMYNVNSSPTLNNIVFNDNYAVANGAGMYNDNSSPKLSNITFTNNNSDADGAGMYNNNSSPKLSNIIFTNNNSSTNGAGMYNYNSSSPILSNVTFSNNIASGSSGSGGGMYNYSSSSPKLTNVTFINNTASGSGGGMYNNTSSNPIMDSITFNNNSATNNGAGMYNDNSSPSITNTTFNYNFAINFGGGMYNLSSSPILDSVVFRNNTANNAGGGMYNKSSNPKLKHIVFNANTANAAGGGIFNYTNSQPILNNIIFTHNNALNGGGIANQTTSSPVLNNVVFINNIASGNGGGMYNFSNSSPILNNVTFSKDSATIGGGIYSMSTSSPVITNTLFWGNYAPSDSDVYIDVPGATNITYSYTQAFISGTGNIQSSVNPFVDTNNAIGADGIWMTADDGLQLACGSSAINVGDNSSVPGTLTTDITDANRVIGGVVDMGAYENSGFLMAPDLTTTACANYMWLGTNYSISGTYTDTITNVAGCDTIISLHLTINNVDVTTTQNDATLSANATGATYKWIDCNNAYSAISGATNQTYVASSNGSYAVEIISNGCVDTSACMSVTTVGIKENGLVADLVKVYPNPVNNELTIESQGEVNEIEIYNLTGQLLQTENPKSSIIKINFSAYQRGVYLIKVYKIDGQVATSRVVKE